MSPADLATLSLLDPDQGVCPNGHPCRLSDPIGNRVCENGEYRGPGLICWEITAAAIDAAERRGTSRNVIHWARAFLEDRG
jgi:hypothetical protein